MGVKVFTAGVQNRKSVLKAHLQNHTMIYTKPITTAARAMVFSSSFPEIFHLIILFTLPSIAGGVIVQKLQRHKKALKTEVFKAFWSCWADSNCRSHPYRTKL